MAQLKCGFDQCGHLNSISEYTYHCERCGKKLDRVSFNHLIELDAEAIREWVKFPWREVRQCASAALLFGVVVALLIRPLIHDPMGFVSVWLMLGVSGFTFPLFNTRRNFLLKKFILRYERIWAEIPNFRPSMSRPK